MKIEDIIKLENSRQNGDSLRTVHLLKEGTFYRAHDSSAWLAVTFPINNAWTQMSVVATKLKEGYIDAWIGFPCSSLKKFIPDDGSVEFKPINDNMIDVVLTNADLSDATAEDIRKQVDQWKNGLEIKESKRDQRETREVKAAAPRIMRFSDIIARIVAMPLEDMSPKEAWEALRDLRRQVAALF